MFRFRLDAYAKWDAPLINIIGKILFFMGLTLLIPVLVALYYGESTDPFLLPAVFCFIISVPVTALFKTSGDLRITDGLFFVATLPLVLTVIGSIPYMLMGFSGVDAIFEALSGFTITGSTILSQSDFYIQPNSMFIWRGMTQWIGGIAVILMFMSLLPLLGIGGKSTFMNEVSGSVTRNYSERLKDSVRQFVTIYAILTAMMMIMCVLLGVDFVGSACLSMSTVSTGGFLNIPTVADYSVAVQIVTMVFMFMGGTNFYLHFRAIYKRDFYGYFKNTEFRIMLIWFLVASVIVFILVAGVSGGVDASITGYKDVLFTVISIGSTTGFSYSDFFLWPSAAVMILLVMMFLGGSSGSTSGGVKIYRGILLIRYIKVAVKKTIHPRAIFDLKVDGASVSENAMTSSMAVILLFLMTIAIGSIVAMMMGFDAVHAFCNTVSQLMNSGPAFTADGSFASVSVGSKILFSVMMWIGRIEIVMALVLITPSFWKEFLRGRSKTG